MVKAGAAVQADDDGPLPHHRSVWDQAHPGDIEIQLHVTDLNAHGGQLYLPEAAPRCIFAR